MKKKRFDISFLVLVMIPIISIVIFVGSIGYAVYSQRQYWNYVEDLSASTVYAYEHEGLKVTRGEETFSVTGDKVYRPYQVISEGGQGKPRRKVLRKNPDLKIEFGDGSKMLLWHVPVKNADTLDGYGMLIRYENAEGKIYCYDTDKIFLDSFNF